MAKNIIAQPSISGISVTIKVFFRPILSDKNPPRRQPNGVDKEDNDAVKERKKSKYCQQQLNKINIGKKVIYL